MTRTFDVDVTLRVIIPARAVHSAVSGDYHDDAVVLETQRGRYDEQESISPVPLFLGETGAAVASPFTGISALMGQSDVCVSTSLPGGADSAAAHCVTWDEAVWNPLSVAFDSNDSLVAVAQVLPTMVLVIRCFLCLSESLSVLSLCMNPIVLFQTFPNRLTLARR